MYVAGRNDPVSPSVYLQWACTRLASIGKIEARWLSATEGRNQKPRREPNSDSAPRMIHLFSGLRRTRA